MILRRIANERPPAGHRLRSARLDGIREFALDDLWDRAGAVALALRERGVRRGDRVGVLASNGPEWVLADLAALRLGAVVAGLEPGKFVPGPEVMARYELAVLLTDVATEADDCHPMTAVAEWATAPPPAADELPPVEWQPDDVVALKFTSGSTGTPKCLGATAGSIESTLRDVQQLFGHGPGDDLFIFLPLSLLQQRYWVYSALAFDHDVTVSNHAAAWLTMHSTEPTVVMGVPAFFSAAQQHIQRTAAQTMDAAVVAEAARSLFGSRIRYLWTGSAPANPATLDFFAACGMPLFEGYGLNETCIVTKNHPGANRRGSAGRALPGKQLLIGDDGVVRVRSEFPVARRYEYAPPGAGERMFRPDGVVWTGDLGYLDEDGFLFVTGRADDVIVLGNGRKVIVRPVEEFLERSPAIAACVLFCPNDTHLVAVVSPADDPADVPAIEAQAAAAIATLERDEQLSRVVIAREPFSTANDLLTAQGKPRRSLIRIAYQSELDDTREGSHVR
jgi:long-chain acyl-CoA synthetase